MTKNEIIAEINETISNAKIENFIMVLLNDCVKFRTYNNLYDETISYLDIEDNEDFRCQFQECVENLENDNKIESYEMFNNEGLIDDIYCIA